MMVNSFLIIGSDKKMIECKKRLNSKGYAADCRTGTDALSEISEYNNIILPLPTIANGYISGSGITLEQLIETVNEGQNIFYGNYTPDNKINAFSYYYNNSFIMKNSYLTAQGVLKMILDNVDYSINKTKVAVIGYGNCGKMISSLLRNTGLDVNVFSRRKETITEAELYGFSSESINKLEKTLSNYRLIVNTVPSNIISKKAIEKLSQDNVYIEVASKPYGFNIADTDVFNFKYILAESLPGRFTPVSAGEIIADTVIDMLKEVKYG